MHGGFSNKPKILHGAFVEYGLSLPPLFVVFQFNPDELNRSHNLTFNVPNGQENSKMNLRQFHQDHKLSEIRKGQQVTIEEESISFDIRLDATDQLNEGDTITEQFGIAPQLATLELMVSPKKSLIAFLTASKKGYSFTKEPNPPMILFIWGRKRVLPVNITRMNIKEEAFSTSLNPIRANVSVNLTVIEGKNTAYKYSKAMNKMMSALNLANIADIADIVIPG